ncbi:hypothetical protein HOY82DRAFT_616578 [Tuber indicum]|nr:hypothetical protein HOY82DRAFT_616578 [Tuber indicum]
MSGSNPSGSDPPRSGSDHPRNLDRPANSGAQPASSGAQPLVSFDDILIDMPDRLPVGDPDDPERLKKEKKERSKRVAFKRAIVKVAAKIRMDKNKGACDKHNLRRPTKPVGPYVSDERFFQNVTALKADVGRLKGDVEGQKTSVAVINTCFANLATGTKKRPRNGANSSAYAVVYMYQDRPDKVQESKGDNAGMPLFKMKRSMNLRWP